MKQIGIDKGLIETRDTSSRRQRGWSKGFFSFRKMFWDMLTKMNVAFFDPCCEEADGSDREPVAWDESQGQVVRFNGTDWVAITAFATTTTTTTTAAPTTTTTTTAPSDVRLKQNIRATGKMVTVKLPEYTWEWNDEAKALGLDHYATIGVLAQEALEVCPEIVSVGDDGYYRVNYGAIV